MTSLSHSPSQRVHQTARSILDDESYQPIVTSPDNPLSRDAARRENRFTRLSASPPSPPRSAAKRDDSARIRTSTARPNRSQSPTARPATAASLSRPEPKSFGDFAATVGETPQPSFFTASPASLLTEFRNDAPRTSKLPAPRTRDDYAKSGGATKRRPASKTTEERDRLLLKTYGNPAGASGGRTNRGDTASSTADLTADDLFCFGGATSRISPLQNNYFAPTERDDIKFVIPEPLSSTRSPEFTALGARSATRPHSTRLTPLTNERVKFANARLAFSSSDLESQWTSNSAAAESTPAVIVTKVGIDSRDRNPRGDGSFGEGFLSSPSSTRLDNLRSSSRSQKSPHRKRKSSPRQRSRSPASSASRRKVPSSAAEVSNTELPPAAMAADTEIPRLSERSDSMAELHEFAQQLLKEEARISSLFAHTSPNRMTFFDKLHKMIEIAESSMYERSIGRASAQEDRAASTALPAEASSLSESSSAIASATTHIDRAKKDRPAGSTELPSLYKVPDVAEGKKVVASQSGSAKKPSAGYKQTRSSISKKKALKSPTAEVAPTVLVPAQTAVPDLEARVPFGFDDVEQSMKAGCSEEASPKRDDNLVAAAGVAASALSVAASPLVVEGERWAATDQLNEELTKGTDKAAVDVPAHADPVLLGAAGTGDAIAEDIVSQTEPDTSDMFVDTRAAGMGDEEAPTISEEIMPVAEESWAAVGISSGADDFVDVQEQIDFGAEEDTTESIPPSADFAEVPFTEEFAPTEHQPNTDAIDTDASGSKSVDDERHRASNSDSIQGGWDTVEYSNPEKNGREVIAPDSPDLQRNEDVGAFICGAAHVSDVSSEAPEDGSVFLQESPVLELPGALIQEDGATSCPSTTAEDAFEVDDEVLTTSLGATQVAARAFSRLGVADALVGLEIRQAAQKLAEAATIEPRDSLSVAIRRTVSGIIAEALEVVLLDLKNPESTAVTELSSCLAATPRTDIPVDENLSSVCSGEAGVAGAAGQVVTAALARAIDRVVRDLTASNQSPASHVLDHAAGIALPATGRSSDSETLEEAHEPELSSVETAIAIRWAVGSMIATAIEQATLVLAPAVAPTDTGDDRRNGPHANEQFARKALANPFFQVASSSRDGVHRVESDIATAIHQTG